MADHASIASLLAKYTPEQLQAMAELQQVEWSRGKEAPREQLARRLARFLTQDYGEAWDAAAVIIGSLGLGLTMHNLCTEMHHIMHG